ncbi:uncharacterized protein LOC131803758 [Musca domestica]|uniref:Uncharacterized protein LOC131803758 n=1 Tax=Musca domestica TaxID=7370 RepID=A0ABM3V6L3_MUSDO|nr:uncharacterized protein LOC131803758 [Musca domestica]
MMSIVLGAAGWVDGCCGTHRGCSAGGDGDDDDVVADDDDNNGGKTGVAVAVVVMERFDSITLRPNATVVSSRGRCLVFLFVLGVSAYSLEATDDDDDGHAYAATISQVCCSHVRRICQ